MLRTKFVATLCMLLSFSWCAAGEPPNSGDWTPPTDLVSHIDQLALMYDLPKEFGQLSDYARYYWGSTDRGRKIIHGELVTPTIRKADEGQIHIVTEQTAPAYADGGCMFVSLEYDVAAAKISSIACNFDLRLPPSPASLTK